MKLKKYIGWARVSSREQEQEGFSLDVQIDAFHCWAKRQGGVVDPIFRVAETATKFHLRKQFRAMIDFAKRHADEYDGLLFYKIDRGLRNMKDMVALEELEEKYNLPFISITQPTENTPSGRLMRRQLATFAAYSTEQQGIDVRTGINRRVEEGWFPSHPPYGYTTRRIEKRSIVEPHKLNANKVRRIFELRANQGLTVPEIKDRMFKEGLYYTDSKPVFSESKLNTILHDKAYIGFVRYKGDWYPGQHKPLVDRVTWDRVRVTFDDLKYRSHALVYASQLIRCGHCGHVVTGEEKHKQTKSGVRSYVYYRCAKYWTANHPRVRLTEAEIDKQLSTILEPLEHICAGTQTIIQSLAQSILSAKSGERDMQASETKRLIARLDSQRSGLINLSASGRITIDWFDRQMAEYAKQEDALRRQLIEHDQLLKKTDRIVAKSAGLFRKIVHEWSSLDRRAKQLVLSSIFGGFCLDERTLVPVNRTLFELFRPE